jgi:DNA polymerase-3 subunit chi
MTQVTFHFNVPERVGYVCRMLRSAINARAQVLVVADEEAELAVLDQALWTFSSTDFVAHCRAEAALEVVKASPVLLAHSADDRTASAWHKDVLLNLSAQAPARFAQYQRVNEIVEASSSDHVLHSARERWRWYAAQGCAVRKHDATPRS